MTKQELCLAAIDAKKRAYAPYSGFCVGAALLTASGQVYTGCNIENASFTPTICAERTAIFKAVSEGERDFTMLAIVGGKGETISPATPPCGVCRQVMSEFCTAEFPVLLVQDVTGDFEECTLGELLPYAFYPDRFTD